jgi:hypothetical protein
MRPQLNDREAARVPAGWIALMEACWQDNAALRPSFAGVLEALRGMLSERFADDASEMSSVGRHGGRGALAHARAERIARSQTLAAMSTDTRWAAMRCYSCCCCGARARACVRHRWLVGP